MKKEIKNILAHGVYPCARLADHYRLFTAYSPEPRNIPDKFIIESKYRKTVADLMKYPVPQGQDKRLIELLLEHIKESNVILASPNAGVGKTTACYAMLLDQLEKDLDPPDTTEMEEERSRLQKVYDAQDELEADDPKWMGSFEFMKLGEEIERLRIGICDMNSRYRRAARNDFITMTDLQDLYSAYGDEKRQAERDIQALKKAHILVIDDLGNSQDPSSARNRVKELLDHRETGTIFTYDGDTNTVMRKLEKRTGDRIIDKAVTIEIGGKSYRKPKELIRINS